MNKRKSLVSDGYVLSDYGGELYPVAVYVPNASVIQEEKDGRRFILYGHYIADMRNIMGIKDFMILDAEASLCGVSSTPRLYDSIDEIKALPMICPEQGAFEAYKPVLVEDNRAYKYGTARIMVPADALRVNPYGQKWCRANKITILDIYDENGAHYAGATSPSVCQDSSAGVMYHVGETICADFMDLDRRIINTHGIIFFMEEEDLWQ